MITRNGKWMVLTAGLLALAVLPGCSTYTTSSGRVDESIDQVFVEYLENLTAEPSIDVVMTDAIIEAIQIDNTLNIVRESEADAIIHGMVTQYRLRPMAARPDLTVNEYQILIAVRLSFSVRATGETIFENKSFTGSGVYTLNDPTGQTTEETAKKEAGVEIVRAVLALVVEDW